MVPLFFVDEGMTDRLLRALSSTHLFLNPVPNRWAHTPLSMCYTESSFRDMTSQMFDFTCQGVFALPKFLKANSFSGPGTYTNSAFQLGARTDLGFWEYLNEVPSRMELFSSGMRATTTIGSGRATGAFPFAEVLSNCKHESVAVVDVGGGRGQALEAIWMERAGAKGRFILQDLPHVIDDGLGKGLPVWMETSKASFFESQPVEGNFPVLDLLLSNIVWLTVSPVGAHIYYFRRIFHDWDQESSRIILCNTKKAMQPHSRILIADMVLPDTNAPRDMALQDLNMMSFGGMERSQAKWKELIESAGLVLRRIWESSSGAKHAVVEAVLPDFAE